jgi:hypothetical protein
VESDSHIAGSATSSGGGFHAGHRRLSVMRSRVPAIMRKYMKVLLLLIPGKLGEVMPRIGRGGNLPEACAKEED